MTLFTADGLLRARLAQCVGMPHDAVVQVCHAYVRWLHTQGMRAGVELPSGHVGLLDSEPRLRDLRAPGSTCISALRAKNRISADPARNDSKGCGGAMRVAPVALVPTSEADVSPRSAFELAAQLAALTHGHPTGQLAAGAFAALVAHTAKGGSLDDAVIQTLALLSERPRHLETSRAMQAVQRAWSAGPVCESGVRSLGAGWIAEEALAISTYCAAATNFEEGVVLAINHDGDSD